VITIHCHPTHDGRYDFRYTHRYYGLSASDEDQYASAEAEALRIAGPDCLSNDQVPMWLINLMTGRLREQRDPCEHIEAAPIQPAVIATGTRELLCADCHAARAPITATSGCFKCQHIHPPAEVQPFRAVVSAFVIDGMLCEGCSGPEEGC
jgi:hypothetical protein